MARERPINTDDLPDDPSLRHSFADLNGIPSFPSFGDDMDVDMETRLNLFGIPPLKVIQPGFTTDDGDHGCSYYYEKDIESFPLVLRPSRYVLYRFPDTNTRTSVHGIYYIETEPQCLPKIQVINSEGEIIKTLGRTEQIDEKNFSIEWMAHLDNDQRIRSTHEVFVASEEQAQTHTIVWDMPSTDDCSLQILKMQHVYYSAAPLDCPIGKELDLNLAAVESP